MTEKKPIEYITLIKRTDKERIDYLQDKIIELIATRIDKQKVKDVIDKVENQGTINGDQRTVLHHMMIFERLKEELNIN